MGTTDYALHRSTHHVVIRWIQTPSPPSVEGLARELTAMRRTARAPLAVVIVIPTAQVAVPAIDARKALQDNLPRVLELCASLDVVLLGGGIRATLMRTALRAMSVVTRTADRISVHSHDGEAAGALPPALAAALAEAPAAPPA